MLIIHIAEEMYRGVNSEHCRRGSEEHRRVQEVPHFPGSLVRCRKQEGATSLQVKPTICPAWLRDQGPKIAMTARSPVATLPHFCFHLAAEDGQFISVIPAHTVG